ncbi:MULTISPECIES: hypothetical protein [Enterobacter cloacae complex]|uniref:hypothetical protein n=1 Tax=Enterobacter cloacae complex TaxID=354276 RepID=UPI00044CC53B|nr:MULTISPECIES: hypothetical protein [Enterobacter cloacae complex]AWR69304.1 hypothetical protein CUN65_13475 [Enterobacter hormaechei subsp. xiangfangensis]AXM00104.1 hypothetical protein DF208_13435 [Enterobacter hormaechei subsp. xiangfangensis]EHK3215410.1 hypothetical protein [Enterobacter hormaechei]EHK3220482.1 hypothetical protein [Enterobacter hormaechei]EHK3225322.1 hypothetical protein [Enterobacter hormaechei]
MSNINKQELREEFQYMQEHYSDPADHDRQAIYIAAEALLDELEAKDKRIVELSHHLQCAHVFIEHTEAFGHAASNGILCCGDAQWNIDASKSALAAAGKGE